MEVNIKLLVIISSALCSVFCAPHSQYLSECSLVRVPSYILRQTDRYCPLIEMPPYVEFPEYCGNSVGDTCYIGCQPGFELIGSCRRTCCMSGRWTGYPPLCINFDIECPPLVAPINGQILEPCQYIAGYTCYYDCGQSMVLIGSPTNTCQIDRTWSDPTPSCTSGTITPTPSTDGPLTTAPTGKTCYDVNPPENGIARGRCVGATVRFICRFECDSGYSLIGPTQIICTENSWSGPPPVCNLVTCPPLFAPVNGILTGQCNPGLLGQICSLTCQPGFRSISETTDMTCLMLGEWDSSSIGCERVTCPNNVQPQVLLNGMVSGSCDPGFVFQTCEYQCNENYALAGGSPSRLCLMNGMWENNETIFCSRIACSEPIVVPKNTILVLNGDCNPGYAGSTCQFSCLSGYALSQGSITQWGCFSNGTWNETMLPTCESKRCPLLETPEWAQDLVNCSTNVTVLVNGRNRMTTVGIGVNSVCALVCKPASLTIDRQSNVTLTCNPLGNWDPSPLPECLKITCPPIQAPENGNISIACLIAEAVVEPTQSDYCGFACNPNYRLTGRKSRIWCQVSGTWTGPPPTCKPIACEIDPENLTTPDIKNGYKTGYCDMANAGQSCFYNCLPGYALVGDSSVDCTAKGWVRKAPSCQLNNQCPPLEVVPGVNGTHGVIDQAGDKCAWLVGATCYLKCDPGYQPRDRASAFRCNSGPVWVPSQPMCEKAGDVISGCPVVAGPTDGYVESYCRMKKDRKENIRVKNFCEYFCNPGFILEGPRTVICTEVMGVPKWVPEVVHKCLRNPCPPLSNPANGVLLQTETCGANSADQVCTFKCNTTYVLKGAETLTCDSYGSWSDDPPACERPTCGNLTLPEPGGSLQGFCQPGLLNEMCTFLCPPGYRIEGPESVTCNDDGGWSGPVPSCTNDPNAGTRMPRTDGPDGGVPGDYCPSVTVPRGGSTSGSCQPGRPGVTCGLRCPPGYRGSRRSVCRKDGTWFPRKPTCFRGRCPRRRRCCPPVAAPRFGRVMNCNLEVGGKCRVACDSGYASSLRGPMTCMGNRRWNPVRSGIKCSRLRSSRRSRRPDLRDFLHHRN